MSLHAVDTSATLPTSAEGAMRATPSPQRIFVPGSLPMPGTAARSLSIEEWRGSLLGPSGTSSGIRTSGSREQEPLDTGAAISELRRLAGLTWAQLARVFGVARRSLHFWASGKRINATNEERLRRLLAVLRQADRGSAEENRVMLLRDHDGMIPIDLLIAGRYEEFLALVGTGRGRRRIDPTPLSREALEARKPLPPAELVDALQDRVHRDVGRGRAARTARSKRRGRD